MKLTRLLCAEHILIDRQTDRVSAINLLDTTRQGKYPAMLPYVGLLLLLERELGEPDQVQLSLVLAQGKERTDPQPLPIHFRGERTARSVVSIDGLILTEPGALDLICLQGHQELGRWTIHATLDGDGAAIADA